MKDIRQETFFQAFCEISDWIWSEFHKMDGLRGPVADQITRSIDSVGANLVEGWARGSNESVKAVLQFYRYSLGSAFESLYWLERIINRGLVNKTKGLAMYKALEENCNALQKFMMNLQAEELRRGKVK